LKNSELRKYKRILEENQKRLKKELECLADEEKLSLKESTGELSSYDNHPADDASESYARSLDRGIRDNTQVLLSKIEDALSKFDQGGYGLCQKCNCEIDRERLELVPYADYCRQCQQEMESREGIRERPIEETSFYPPFRGFNDGTGDVGYDAEDTWQELARYGSSNPPAFGDPEALSGNKVEEKTYYDADEDTGISRREDSLVNKKDND